MPAKKLIEAALPLEAINQASAREKSIRHGHPSTLHLWWSRKPLATTRAAIFSSLVDDPDDPQANPAFVAACKSLPPGDNVTASGDTPRMRLFDFIERLVKWENTTDEDTMNTARRLIRIATNNNPPPLLDPFAGGGSIPLEAQRLGLEAHASDLNPVAVMINKAMIEIPPRFANQPPVNPEQRAQLGKENWRGAAGLAADVRYYGAWMREKAHEKIGHLYLKHKGETVIAWLWARTVISPNPAVNAPTPLVSSFALSKKKGRECWAKPIIEGDRVRFEVTQGAPPKHRQGTMIRRQGARCIFSDQPIPFDTIRAEGKAGRLGAQLMAIVTQGAHGRNYHDPTDEAEQLAKSAEPEWRPIGEMPDNSPDVRGPLWGLYDFADLFTPRQLTALTTFSDLVDEARQQAYQDALAAGLPNDDIPLRDGGRGAFAYGEAINVYLTFVISRAADFWSTLCPWVSVVEAIVHTFIRQAIPMVWSYAEANPFSDRSVNWSACFNRVALALERLLANVEGIATQKDAVSIDSSAITLSTDPPYYDNIGYADLSDFFYVWMRKSLRSIYPDVFGTMLVPKASELIASRYRHNNSKQAASDYFESGMLETFNNIRKFVSPNYPLTVYYAFKQQDAGFLKDGKLHRGRTGWETMLTSLMAAGFSIVGTWPMRTELSSRMRAKNSNALASSIILVCRPRPDDAPGLSALGFRQTLKRELPPALKVMQSGNINPVDMAQASIGPGMAVYSRYSRVLEPDGKPLSVRAALLEINAALDEYLDEQDGELDGETRFAVDWFKQHGFDEGGYGDAETLSRAKNTAVESVEIAGLVKSGGGRVSLWHWSDIDPSWDPRRDQRPTVWEAAHHLIQRLVNHGEQDAAKLLARMPAMGGEARQLAYRLYKICDDKGWAKHAFYYNDLVVRWRRISDLAASIRNDPSQMDLL